MLSLNRRVLIAASAILASFFGIAGITLDRAYRVSIENALIERLQSHVYTLIALATQNSNGDVYIPNDRPETQFSVIAPGLYAQISGQNGKISWRSLSMADQTLPFVTSLSRNQRHFSYTQIPNDEEYALYSFGVAWDDRSQKQTHTFSVAMDLESVNHQVKSFRRSLWTWLGGVALLLLAVQGAILRWGLKPLDLAAGELRAIEAGEQLRLNEQYPKELQKLTDNLNNLLAHQQEHLERYRHTLGDLAHSLKTPLAVLQSVLEQRKMDEQTRGTIQEQLDRMAQITEHQLQRAATAGQSPLVAPVSIHAIVNRILSSLHKVYADKDIAVSNAVDVKAQIQADEGDVLEILGNIIDNAYKWSVSRVSIATQFTHNEHGMRGVLVSVTDDGAGVPQKMLDSVKNRGVRADLATSGHGIGLSIVQDIVQIYGGQFKIGNRKRGSGTEVEVWLPEKI